MKKNNKKKKGGRIALSIVRRHFPGVTAVNDATKDAMVEVTPADNKNAKVLDHNHCALAVACQRATKAQGVIISIRTAYLIFGKLALRYRMLESTSREIVSFDRRAGFSPGTYKLRAPADYEKLGFLSSGKTHHPSGRRTPRFRHMTSNIRTVLGGKQTE